MTWLGGLVLRTGRAIMVGGVCAATLAGCGKSDQPAASKGQVVATVGSEVVTTQELESEFRALNVPSDRQRDPELVKRVLGDLVARKYLLQQAVNAKLDREPGVLLDILRSREQVLANASISRTVAAKVSAISKADVEKYIAANPTKFADRRLITAEQITFAINGAGQSISDVTRDVRSLEDADQKLTALGIPHGRSTGVLNSAELPDELLKTMRAKGEDDVVFVRSGPNGVFLKVRNEESRPLSGEAAISTARQLLRNDMMKAEAGMVSVSANLEAKYEGDFAGIMRGDNAPPAKN
jgi:EpsD family peptidyl-prolyl cis-trans isomerase